MKFLSFSYVSALLAYGAIAQEKSALESPDKFQPPAMYGVPLSELGIGSQMVRLTYPGVNKDRLSTEAQLAVQFYKWDKAPSQGGLAYLIETQGAGGIVDHPVTWKPTCFGFALPAEDVKNSTYYSAKFCIKNNGDNGDFCSDLSEPATPIDPGSDKKLSCGSVTDIPIVDIDEVTAGRSTENSIQVIRYKLDYDMSTYKEMLESNAFCSRKYIVSLLVHIMKKDNQQVMDRHRLTPQVSEAVLQMIKENKAVPIAGKFEVSADLASVLDADSDAYELRFTMCYDEKDKISQVQCSKPFIVDMPSIEA